MNNVTLRDRQRGLSLIELMVAMLIGLFLMLGVTQIFINNQKSYLFQQGQLGNEENGRFALSSLNQELLKAGYRSFLVPDIPSDNSTVSDCTFNAGEAVAAISATSFCIQYQATSKADVNCLGTALVAADISAISAPYSAKTTVVRPKIVEKIAFDANTSAVTCTTSAGTQQLVTGVKDLRFEYGSGVAGSKAVTSFSTTPTGTIAAVRYSALMQSPGSSTIRDDTSQTSSVLTDWNSRYSTTYGSTTAEKASIYQIVQGTTMIRNQLQ